MTPQSPSERVAVFGDLSGHVDPFVRAIERLGVDTDSGRMPRDLKIVSVGDLIHKGPDSDSAVALVDYLMSNNPNQVVVLAGNHEAQHLGGPEIRDSCNCSHETIHTLADWRRDGKILAAVAVGPELDTLVTHAGLGRPAWEQLGRPATAVEAAELLNRQLRTSPQRTFEAGQMLATRRRASGAPGVAWAHGPQEVYETWRTGTAPFNQIHGHVDVYYWAGRRWGAGMTPELQALSSFDPSTRQTVTHVGGKSFTGIDPGYTARWAANEIKPLVVQGLSLAVPPPGPTFAFG